MMWLAYRLTCEFSLPGRLYVLYTIVAEAGQGEAVQRYPKIRIINLPPVHAEQAGACRVSWLLGRGRRRGGEVGQKGEADSRFGKRGATSDCITLKLPGTEDPLGSAPGGEEGM